MAHETNTGKEVKIIIPEAVQGGKFSNVAQIHATDTEVTFDFAYLAPNTPTEGILVSRVVITPAHAKSFLQVLEGVVAKTYGTKQEEK